MPTLQLTYDPNAQGAASGWYLPATDPASWIAAAAQAPASSTKFYLAPRSISDQTAGGLIALHTENAQPIPTGAVALVVCQSIRSEVELWLPLFAKLSLDMPIEELLSIEQFRATHRYVWLPPDDAGQARLIGMAIEDEVDLSVLIKPFIQAPSEAAAIWFAPPRVPRLPDRVLGLLISREFLEATPFNEEQESIGGDSDDLMSIDNEGRPSGGGFGSMAGRMFRRSLEKLIKALKDGPNPAGSSKREQLSNSSQTNPSSRSAQGSTTPKITRALYQKLQSMLADQREKQLTKLLALMARDPDRALKYAVPMANQAAPRGLSQPGTELGKKNVDFSLTGLFGGGQPVDPWDMNYQLRAQLMAAYRSQADRETAAGRYRRAAYIYAHLMGDLSAAALVLEKGRFFIEAGALYKSLKRPLDHARCLRNSGQLTEAALIYEDLKQYESAAEMWNAAGNQSAAGSAYEKACKAAIASRDVLKAVSILETHLGDAVRAEQLLWSQWPRGHQVFECTKLAFNRLADQNRIEDAHHRFEELIAATERAEQTLLARLCADLNKSFPDRALRTRAEDQCRLSAIDRLSMLQLSEFQ